MLLCWVSCSLFLCMLLTEFSVSVLQPFQHRFLRVTMSDIEDSIDEMPELSNSPPAAEEQFVIDPIFLEDAVPGAVDQVVVIEDNEVVVHEEDDDASSMFSDMTEPLSVSDVEEMEHVAPVQEDPILPEDLEILDALLVGRRAALIVQGWLNF